MLEGGRPDTTAPTLCPAFDPPLAPSTQAGFGSNVGFQTTGRDGVSVLLGSVGFAHTGDGGASANFELKAFNGAATQPLIPGNAEGAFTLLTVEASGNVVIPKGGLTVAGTVTSSGDVLLWGTWSVSSTLNGLIAGVVVLAVFNLMQLTFILRSWLRGTVAAPLRSGKATASAPTHLELRAPQAAGDVVNKAV